MTTRYWAETECVHGEQRAHFHVDGVVAPNAYDPKAELCKGGTRRELTIDYRAACWALVNSHAVDAISEIGGLTLSDVILAVQAALGGAE